MSHSSLEHHAGNTVWHLLPHTFLIYIKSNKYCWHALNSQDQISIRISRQHAAVPFPLRAFSLQLTPTHLLFFLPSFLLQSSFSNQSTYMLDFLHLPVSVIYTQQMSVFKMCREVSNRSFQTTHSLPSFLFSPPPHPPPRKKKERRYLSNTKAKSLIMKSWNLSTVSSVSVSCRLGTVHDCLWIS